MGRREQVPKLIPHPPTHPPPGPFRLIIILRVGASAYFLVEWRGGLMPHSWEMCLGTERVFHNPGDCGIPAVWVSTFLGNVETGQGP